MNSVKVKIQTDGWIGGSVKNGQMIDIRMDEWREVK